MKTNKILHLGILLLFSLSVSAQNTDWGWDWKDSSKIPAKRMPQHNEFLNNNYPYPAQPRDQWELGIGAGASFLIADVNPKVGLGGSLTLRKALNHTFSLRAGYFGSLNSGEPNGYGAATGKVEYKNQTHMAGLDVIASLNTASYYRGNPKTNIYVLGGYSFITSRSMYKAPGGQQSGGYNIFYGQTAISSTQTGVIGTVGGNEVNGRKSWVLLHGISAGGGIAFKLSNKANIGLEQRFTMPLPGHDYLDAVKGGNSNDVYSYSSVRLNLNVGSTSKRVQPLWWLNPNNFAYSELNKPAHMKLPKPILDDADGDGVTDQFDLEPNTPAGAKVDTHGRALDTDGDGIPDFRDKEPLTSQKCFPVNNDGVGTCPEPSCCKELRDEIERIKSDSSRNGGGGNCGIGDLPSIQFKGNAKLTKDAQAVLAVVAQKINAAPSCRIKVIGYGTSDKKAQQTSWDRVNAVIKYLVEKQGIAESRLIFSYGQEGDSNTVDLQGTTEEGPNTVPAPHPNLRK